MADIYEKFEQHVITLTTAGTEYSFPTPNKYSGVLGQPEAIAVQTVSANTVNIVVGKTGVKSDLSVGGWVIPPNADSILPSNSDEVLIAVASADNQKLLVTYLAGKVRI